MKKKLFSLALFACFFALAIIFQMSLNGPILKAERNDITDQKTKFLENAYAGLEFKTISGLVYKTNQLKDKVVVLNFWASWCLPCMKEFQSLEDFYKKYKEDVLIIALNNDDEDQMKNIKKTVKKMNVTFPIFADVDSKYTEKFMISKIPATAVFKNGKLLFFKNEEMDFQDKSFDKLIKSNLN